MPASDRDPENENLKPGAPPHSKTGGAGTDSSKTFTNPSSGETEQDSHAKNKSAAEEEAPAAQKDRRVKPDA